MANLQYGCMTLLGIFWCDSKREAKKKVKSARKAGVPATLAVRNNDRKDHMEFENHYLRR